MKAPLTVNFDHREELEVLKDILELYLEARDKAIRERRAPAVDRTLDKVYIRVCLRLEETSARASRLHSPCGCECCHNGFCGGCGHAGCGYIK